MRHRHLRPLLLSGVKMRIPLLLGLLALQLAAADEPLTRVEFQLDQAKLTWQLGQGLTVDYAGRRVWLPFSSQLTLHDERWSGHYYSSNGQQPAVALSTEGESKVLTLDWPEKGFRCHEVLTVGPGDRFKLDYTFYQNQWDDAHLQCAFAKPTEAFWAGAKYHLKNADGESDGVIPAQWDPAVQGRSATVFRGATDLTVHSPFGTVTVASTQPLFCFDYAERNGALWLGWDELIPRDEKVTWHVDVTLAPAEFEVGGVVLSGLRVPDRVENGLLQAGVKLARGADGPAGAKLKLRLQRDGEAIAVPEVAVTLTDQPVEAKVELPLTEPGQYQLGLTVQDAAGKTVWELPAAPLTVLSPCQLTATRSFYTDEAQGALLVTPRAGLPAEGLKARLTGAGLDLESPLTPGQRSVIPFDLAALALGETTVQCQVLLGERVAGQVETVVRKLTPQANEVKIDHLTGGLIVDGLPTYPFGAYCFNPPAELAEQEAAMAFTHLAPYRRSDFNTEGAEAEMMAALDRCAQIGIRVHYDVRKIASMSDTPEKWALLKREVEAVRNHPALLCWYINDEPELHPDDSPPERMAETYRFIRALDPYHPCTMVFARRDAADSYADGMDIVMADPYPIPHQPPAVVARATDEMVEMMGARMPVWIVPQAFGGGEGWRREPTADEAKLMTYLAAIHGAKGIQYFMRVLPNVRPMTPALWAACRQLGAEFEELSPELLSGQPQPMVTVQPETVDAAAWRSDRAILVLVANTSKTPVNTTVKVAGLADQTATVLFENRAVDVVDGTLAEPLSSYGVRAYRIELQPPAEDVPGNLLYNGDFEHNATAGTPDGYYISAGKDVAASAHLESRLAFQGRHCLRVVTPTDGGGLYLAPFPFPVTEGTRYRVKLAAKSLVPGAKLLVRLGILDNRELRCELTGDWQTFEFTGTAKQTERRGQLSYRLETAGTAWVDALEVTALPKGDE